ncbi:unnamed protein product, partial [Hapterophycus canaliculatus]
GAFDAVATRIDPTGRGDGFLQRDLWMPLWLLMPLESSMRADKLRPVPNAFEMDAVVWNPGPFAPETDPGSGWLLTARMAALKAPNKLLRVAVDSEPMRDDSAKSLDVKDRFRQGKMGGIEFTRIMTELKRSGADRIERAAKSNATAAATGALTGARSRAITSAPGLTVSTTSSTPIVTDPWQGRDGGAAGAGRSGGSDTNRFADFGPTGLKLKRPANSSGVLSKLGGRLVSGLTKAEHASGGGSSPTGERARSEAGGLRRLRSPRRASSIGSPRHRNQDPGTSEGGVQTGSSWRPWSVPRSDRRLASSASSPERPAPSPADTGTPVRGGDAPEADLQARHPVPGASQTHRAGHDATGSAPPGPLTASEIDNLSSVSTTSTVLTDLSLRMEKIEDLLARLLEASTGGKGASGGSGGNNTLDRWGRVLPGRGSSHDADAGSSDGGRRAGEATASATRHPSNVLNEKSAGELRGEVKDTAAELRQVRGRLRQLELEEAAAKAGAAASLSAATRAASTIGPRTPPPSPPSVEREIAQYEAVTSRRVGGVVGGGGEQHFIQGVVPPSALPACRDDSCDEEELLRLSASAKEEQSHLSPSRDEDAAPGSGVLSHPPVPIHIDEKGDAGETGAGCKTTPAGTQEGPSHPDHEHARSSRHRENERGDKAVGTKSGGKEDETKGGEPDGGPPRGGGRGGPLVGGGALRQARSFGLSPISEASS